MNSLPIIFFIPFRAGSKGLKHKNISLYKNKPLFAHSVDIAHETNLGEIYISTDYDVQKLDGLTKKVNFISRPNKLATDDAVMSNVVLEFIESNVPNNSIIILLQVTSPNRSANDIHKAIKKFNNNSYDLLMSVTEVSNSLLKSGLINADEKFEAINNIDYCFSNRQDASRTFKPNGSIYIFESSWFKVNKTFSSENIGTFIMDKDSSLDIDKIEDLEHENK